MISKVNAIQVIGIGAGGHSKVVIEILRSLGSYEILGLLDNEPKLLGSNVLGIKVIGNDSLLDECYASGIRFAFNGVGSVGNTQGHRMVYERTRRSGFEFVSAIHPQAIISISAKVGDGPTIMAGGIVNADVQIGNNVILNTGAVVEHDCRIGDHAHIATGAFLAGDVRIGSGSHIGIGAIIKQGVTVGENCVVGAGSVVLKDVPDNVVVVGVPARKLER